MYNHQGIYTISGDMCYENAVMKTSPSGGRLDETTIHLNEITEHTNNGSATPLRRSKTKKYKFRFALLANIVLLIIVTLVIVLIEFGYIPNIRQGFICQDPTLSHPYHGDTIKVPYLLAGSIGLPFLIFLLVEYVNVRKNRKLVVRLIKSWLKTFFIGMYIVLLVTQVCKVLLGELRPHFFETCLPDAGRNCTPGSFVYSYKCTNVKENAVTVIDSARSFPSGHAAISGFASLYTAAFILYRLQITSQAAFVKPFLICVSMLWSLSCSISRLTDHRHHWWDVLFGLILGYATALYVIQHLTNRFAISLPPQKKTINITTASTTALIDIKNKDATSVII